MRGKLLIGVAGLIGALATPAQAASYIQLSGGALTGGNFDGSLEATGFSSFSEGHDLDSGALGSAVFGEEYEALGKNTFGLEAEALYLSSDIEGDATSLLGADASVDMWGLIAQSEIQFPRHGYDHALCRRGRGLWECQLFDRRG